ncbi:lamin tail domain-containing protein [Agrococcus beijingensis]|uniref:lamin tail domain-containing protein n=1 Tax=Agrococcus beijingensis TaxID=3068634 RepID=UPI0027407FBC|nr:lamin tail domain-containing protein [Agrococcus sp. REN33]
MRRRSSAMLAAAIPAALLATLLTAPAAHAADADIRINEVQSNSALGAPDFIELINTGAEPVDISDWLVKDSDDARTLRVPAGTVVAPGGFALIEPDSFPDGIGFGLGSDDAARIYAADDTTLVDSYAWIAHAFTEGRLPDGSGAFVDTEPTPGAVNIARAVVAEPVPFPSPIVVNEVRSNDSVGDDPDWVELLNTSATESVDVSGWILRDDDPLSSLPIAAGSIVAPGGFLVVETSVDAISSSFGLGKADEITLLTADGTGLVDHYAWTEHAETEGRLPDGTGAFVDTEPTRGAANVERFADSAVVINEVESNGDTRGDWVELYNADLERSVDISGWTIVDTDPSHTPLAFPAGSVIESGGYVTFVTDAAEHAPDGFGLGGGDGVTIRDAAGAVVDSVTWTSHAAMTLGLCAGGETLVETASATFGLVNDCGEVAGSVVPSEAWPFGDDVANAVAPGTWTDDMSGLDYAADGTLFAVKNDNAEIFEMSAGTDGAFTVAQSWIPGYVDGSGQPDAEGISVAGDGAIFLSTERDNAFKSVSRPSILRVELGADGATTTTHEWNLTSVLGPLGANLGPEAIEWISDADAVRLGVLDQSSIAGPGDVGAAAVAYDPAAFGEHFGGIFAVAVEQTGLVHLFVLEADGSVTMLQSAEPGPAVEVVMALDWRAGGNALWALCDDACSSASSELAFVDGLLTTLRDVAAPTTMPAGYTNEGLAFAWCAVDPAATPTVAWISDTAHDGVSLRVAPGDACEAAVTPPPATGGGTGAVETPVVVQVGAGAGATTGDTATKGAGTLPRTGGEAPTGAIIAALLLMLAGLGLTLRRRSAL